VNAPQSLLLLLGLAALSGCVTEPLDPPPPLPPPAPDTNLYFYPAPGRDIPAEQQDRDKYECNTWAVQQTGFDPSEPSLPPHQHMRIVASGPPPGAQAGAGALTGAVVGAAVSRPWDAGRGALFGALAGAAIGGIAESERDNQVKQMQTQANVDSSRAQTAALEQKAGQFRRAIGACLEARGYSVK
jgi:hypothetical protein